MRRRRNIRFAQMGWEEYRKGPIYSGLKKQIDGLVVPLEREVELHVGIIDKVIALHEKTIAELKKAQKSTLDDMGCGYAFEAIRWNQKELQLWKEIRKKAYDLDLAVSATGYEH